MLCPYKFTSRTYSKGMMTEHIKYTPKHIFMIEKCEVTYVSLCLHVFTLVPPGPRERHGGTAAVPAVSSSMYVLGMDGWMSEVMQEGKERGDKRCCRLFGIA